MNNNINNNNINSIIDEPERKPWILPDNLFQNAVYIVKYTI